jgi:hypothetical protein
MQMKYWRLSVKSRSQVTKLLTFGLAVSCFALLLACQHAQLAPYSKFENDSQVPRIPLDEAKKDFDAGTAVFVDSRAEVSYDQEHVAGAVNIPVGTGDEKFSSLPKNKKIIVYCS